MQPEEAKGQAHTQRVRFGAGLRTSLNAELSGLGCSRALLLATPEQSDITLDLASTLSGYVAGLYTRVAMHTPVEITQDALCHSKDVGADCFVAIGGGSTIGLAKALALRTGLPQIALPTTYAGSEATPILGQTENGVKTTLTDPRVLPDVVIYDLELVTSLPPKMSVTSGLNAMAHAAEALYAKARDDDTTALAVAGLTAFSNGLPRVLADPRDLAAREATLRGAYSCGAVLGRVGMALHHKLCHTLGGSFDLPHAATHAIILPHAIAYNELAVPRLLRPLAELLGGETAGDALWAFAKSLGAPTALRDLGIAEADLDRAAEMALEKPYWNPREITKDGIRALLQSAWSGNAPTP